MQWLADIIPGVFEKLGTIAALVICFAFWAWIDHMDKRHLTDTIHSDMVRIEQAINTNTGVVEKLQLQLAEKER